MTKKIVSIICLVATICFVACKQDVPTLFNETDGLYFSAPSDSILYTFAKFPTRTVDTLKVPVTVLGNPSNVDR
ncbi:MAG TPA: hypothetical protein VFL47_12375, partial [Flavisolibacter sp.]|nr:hypothetical protein [Flavisolibacter sp.]